MSDLKNLKKRLWDYMSKYLRLKIPYCQICMKQESHVIHHIIKRSVSSALMYNEKNLLSLCEKCHNKIHAPMRNRKQFEDTEMATILLNLIGEQGIYELEARRHDIKKYSKYELTELIEQYKQKIGGVV